MKILKKNPPKEIDLGNESNPWYQDLHISKMTRLLYVGTIGNPILVVFFGVTIGIDPDIPSFSTSQISPAQPGCPVLNGTGKLGQHAQPGTSILVVRERRTTRSCGNGKSQNSQPTGKYGFSIFCHVGNISMILRYAPQVHTL